MGADFAPVDLGSWAASQAEGQRGLGELPLFAKSA